jgi:hypothetical protein
MLASTAGFAKGTANWDEDSPQLPDNLTKVLREIRADKERRITLTSESARQWQRETMDGIEVPSPEYVGKYRGEVGVANIHVWIGSAAKPRRL